MTTDAKGLAAMREAFEKEHVSEYGFIPERMGDVYADENAEAMWHMWQAALASLPRVTEKESLVSTTRSNEKKSMFKCNTCQDTGKITWTDYSNGQGLDIDREDDCDKCNKEEV